MIRVLGLALLLFGTEVMAINCGDQGRASQSVVAWSGEQELGFWEVTDDSLKVLSLQERDVAVRVTPAPKERYERLRHAGDWHPEIVRIDILAADSDDLLVRGWGGANSLQDFKIESLGKGGLKLLLLKPVCVRVGQDD
ncbi:MAG: hypothetical protein AAF358_21420 [Pseudomonadota bacterium]